MAQFEENKVNVHSISSPNLKYSMVSPGTTPRRLRKKNPRDVTKVGH